MAAKATMAETLVMAPKSVTFQGHDHLVSVLFGDLLSHSYNITFSMFLYLVTVVFDGIKINVFEEQLINKDKEQSGELDLSRDM